MAAKAGCVLRWKTVSEWSGPVRGLMLAHVNDGQVLVLLKPCSTSELQTIHTGKGEFQRCFKPPTPPPPPGPLIAVHSVGRIPAHTGRERSLSCQAIAITEAFKPGYLRELTLWVDSAGTTPSCPQSSMSASPCHLQGCGGKVTPLNTMDYFTSTRSFILFIRHLRYTD